MKVGLIVGLEVACRKQELPTLCVNNVKVENVYIHIYLPNTQTKTHCQFVVSVGNNNGINLVESIRKCSILRPKHSTILLVRKNTFAASPKNIITLFLKLKNPEMHKRHSFN